MAERARALEGLGVTETEAEVFAMATPVRHGPRGVARLAADRVINDVLEAWKCLCRKLESSLEDGGVLGVTSAGCATPGRRLTG